MTQNFLLVQIDEEWHLFYCESTLGCRVIQDLDLCKLEDLWHHNVDPNAVKSQKMEYLWILYKTETLLSCYTHHKVPW